MTAIVLDGKVLAKKIGQSLEPRIQALKKRMGRPARLAIVSSSQTHEGQAYVHSRVKACAQAGIEAEVFTLSPSGAQSDALRLIDKIQTDPRIDAVIMDSPLPAGIDFSAVVEKLDPAKDAEGVSPINLGRLFSIKTYAEISSRKIPGACTALAIAELLRETQVPLAGKRAVVIGRSNIVGKPAAHLLTALDLTVTLCHSKTRDLAEAARRADVLVACLGRGQLVKGDWIKDGAIIIDAGMSDEGGKLVGDVDFEAAEKRASYITPVPGGVGPVTTALLLANITALAERRAA